MPQGGSFLLYEGKGGDDFWVKAETLLYVALIGYIHYELEPEKQNFATLIDMLDKMQVREDNEDYCNEVDDLFEALAQRKPEHFAVRQYLKYKMASGKTAKSILVSCGARLAVFDIDELREITAYLLSRQLQEYRKKALISERLRKLYSFASKYILC